MEILLIALTLAVLGLCALHIRPPPPNGRAPAPLDPAEHRRLAAARQEQHNFLHYCGDIQPPVDAYAAAHQAAHK